MATILIKTVLLQIYLPFFLILGAILRPSFISLGYILLALLCNTLPSIRLNATFPRSIYAYTFFCVVISLATTLLQFGYQLYQHFKFPYDESYVKICNSSSYDSLNYWLRQSGFIRVPIESDIVVLRLFIPEIFALLGSLVTFIVCTAYPTDLTTPRLHHSDESEGDQHQAETELSTEEPRTTTERIQSFTTENYADVLISASKRVSDAIVVFVACLVGILNPSLLNLPYFLFFVISLTWWALYTPLRRHKFNCMKLALEYYLALHFLAIFAYQIEFFQQILPPDSLISRLLGLYAIVIPSKCSTWYQLEFNFPLESLQVLNFGAILFLYYLLAIQYRWTKHGVKTRERLTAFVPLGTTRTVVESFSGDVQRRDAADSTLHDQLLSDANTRTDTDALDVVALQRITSEVMDRQKINQLIKSRRKSQPGSLIIQAVQETLYFFLYHCYVFALLSMMMWAILYHSVFGLIFLILTCFLWALVDSRKWIFRLSPLILAYVQFLLMVQYVYSMNLKKELSSDGILKTIGFVFEDDKMVAFRTLLLKILLSLPFFVLLRLHLREDYYNSLSGRERLRHINYGTFDNTIASEPNQSCGKKFAGLPHIADENPFVFISQVLTKYWIFLVVFCILINSPLLATENNLFSIGFFVFFISLLLIFQLSFRLFRNVIFGFLTLLIIYSSLILIALYCYQFDQVPKYWKDWTGFSEEFTREIGLQHYSVDSKFGALFERLIKIISLIVVTMLQLKFFHDPWTKLVKSPDIGSRTDLEEPDLNRTDFQRFLMRTVDYWKELKEFGWRFAEVHLYKLTLFILLYTCLCHFCFLNLLPVIFIALALCSATTAQYVIFSTCVYLALLFIGRRIYQFKFIPSIDDYIKGRNCSERYGNITDVEDFNTTSKWVGIEREGDVASDILGILVVLVLIGIQFCIKYRQINTRKLQGIPEPQEGILFPNAHPKDFDRSLKDCIKFLFNYGFYKFGVEISFSAMAFVAWHRMDAFGALLMVWLLIMVILPRSGCKKLWPFLVAYMAVLLPLQYLMAIGLPENLCIDYPWDYWLKNIYKSTGDGWMHLNNNLAIFLGLANYRLHPGRFLSNIVADFILLAIVAAQNRVFGEENEIHPAGSNESIYKDGKFKLFKNNPHYDFIVEQRSFVDFFKYVIFMYGHWITMIMVLCAGLGATSLFALGYVMLAFWMLWQGNSLYTMRDYPKTLRKWRLLAVYTVVIMICKIVLQLIGCVFIGLLKSDGMCSVQQLFSIFCVNALANKELTDYLNLDKDQEKGEFSSFQKCTSQGQPSEANIEFDAIAFLFIIFQLRIFHSWFFQRCMIEFRCEVIQANRGAILINQLIEKEMREQTEQQNKKLREIKERTAAIRKRYEEQQKRSSGYGSMFFSPETYGQARQRRSQTSISTEFRPQSMVDVDDPLPSYDPRTPCSPVPAKRAGDYYMFDYDPETDELIKPVDTFVPEVTPGAGDFDKLDPAQLLHTALGKDLNLIGTLDSVEEAEQIKDEKLRMIAAVAPSKKAREIAKKALYHRQHPEQQAGSSLLHAIEEDTVTSMARTINITDGSSREKRRN